MKYNHYLYSVGLAAFLASLTSYAVPFNITPQGSLPTTVLSGSSVNAAYTITNNTLTTRLNNYVRWFPPNVVQVTDPTDATVCSTSFNLGPSGSINQSCTLKLKISGTVNRHDPNPQNHLFVCFPGGKTCAGPTPENSLNVSTESNNPGPTTISTSVGGYSTNTASFPAAYTSTDNGVTWTASVPPSTTAIPIGSTISFLTSVACNGKFCTSVGFYTDGIGSQFPLSYSSSDKGVTWSEAHLLPLNSVLLNSTDVGIRSVSCSGNNCVSVGYYRDSLGEVQPLSYSSSDNGVTWSQPYFPSTSNLPAGSKGGGLSGVSCSGTTCNTVGFYNDVASAYQPLVYHSTDSGVTWSPAIFPPATGFPVGFTGNARIMSVICSASNCTAIGVLEDPAVPGNTLSYSTLSSDGGLSWSSAHLLSGVGLPVGNRGAFMLNIDCVGNNCVTVGYYRDAGSQLQSAYYTSADRGLSWSNALLPPDIPLTAQSSALLSVSCLGNICSTVGGYIDSGLPYPLTYHSTNYGVTWSVFLPSFTSIPSAIGANLYGVGGSQSGVLQT